MVSPLPLHFVIDGHPYVKKSNQKVQQRGRRQVKVNTPSYNRWLGSALQQFERYGYDPAFKDKNKKLKEWGRTLLQAQIDEPINLQCVFYLQTAGRVDLSALYEGIQDVLVAVGCLSDDNYKVVVSHDGSYAIKDAQHPRIEITITKREIPKL